MSPGARELGFKVPGWCYGGSTAEEVQVPLQGPHSVLHGGVQQVHWREGTQGCVTSDKGAGSPRCQRTDVGEGTAAAEGIVEDKVDRQ